MAALPLALTLVLVGCSSRTRVEGLRCAADGMTDADSCWLASLPQSPETTNERLAEHCSRIETLDTRWACLSSAAYVVRFEPDRSREICQEIDSPHPREDCVFFAMDEAREAYTPLEWTRACSQDLHKYRGDCMTHSVWMLANGLTNQGKSWLTRDHWPEQLDAMAEAGGPRPLLDDLANVLREREGQDTPANPAKLDVQIMAVQRLGRLHWRSPDDERWW